MSKRRILGAALVAAAVMCAVPARAIDPWEGDGGDDTGNPRNAITAGGMQIHDLEQESGVNDIDWIYVPTLARHSYEGRASSGNVVWDLGACPSCAQFERIGTTGTILTDDVSTVGHGTTPTYDRSVRWIASTTTTAERLRITGASALPESASAVYTLRFWDTTYSIPRWNASNGQTTVVILSNMVQATVTGNVYFYNPSGTLVATQPFTLAQNATAVISTASLPALSGLSGHAQVAHTGGYGALSGKAVSLEPATGFTFDTALMPIAQ